MVTAILNNQLVFTLAARCATFIALRSCLHLWSSTAGLLSSLCSVGSPVSDSLQPHEL